MVAPSRSAGAMFAPECVDNLRPMVLVIAPLLCVELERVEVLPHGLPGGLLRPLAFVSTGAVAGVERRDLWLDHTFDVVEEPTDLLRVHLGEFVLDDQPRHRVV